MGFLWQFKASLSVHKITPKTPKWLPYILICHCTSLSPWFIILDKNNFINVSHYYWVPIWAPMYSMLEWWSRVGEGWRLCFSCENTHRDPQMFIFSIQPRKWKKWWPWMPNTLILSNLLWQVQKHHVSNIEGSFNTLMW